LGILAGGIKIYTDLAFPFDVKIDTIKIDVFFNIQTKVTWRELKMVTSSNPCKTRKLCEEPFNKSLLEKSEICQGLFRDDTRQG